MIQNPSPKRMKKSVQKVCVVLRPYGFGRSESFCYIYFLDLPKDSSSSSSLARRRASFKFTGRYPVGAAYMAVGSTLYVFGGVARDVSRGNFSDECYSYDLSALLSDSDDDPSCNLNFTSMKDEKYNIAIKPIPSMAYGKCAPRAVIIGSRICVFSSEYYTTNHPGPTNFELYDPVANSWSTLPDPPDPHRFYYEEPCEIKFFCVDENSRFFITTNLMGTFCIDLDQLFTDEQQPKWVPYDFPDLCYEFGYSSRALVKVDDLLLTPGLNVHVVDVPSDVTERPPPQDLSYCVEQGQEEVLHASDRAIIRLLCDNLTACFVEVGGFKYIDDNNSVSDSVVRVTQVEFGDGECDGDDPSDDQLMPTILGSSVFYADDRIYTYDIKIVGAFAM